MTIWSPELQEARGPRYLAIAERLQRDIERGLLPPGSRLPTHRELAYRLGVTIGTVSRAYLEAERRGLIQGEVGRGTFVRPRGANVEGSAAGMMIRAGGPQLIDFSLNHASVADTASELASAFAQLARRRDLAPLLGYQHELGLPPHRAAGAAWLARTGVAVPPERVAVTCGAQHALHCALVATARPGDPVLVEALTYPALKSITAQLGLRLHPVAIDREGLLPDALEAAAAESGARLLVTMPSLHNPTAAVMPAERRAALVAVARRRELIIVEDDIYGFLLEERPPPLIALAPERVIHLTSVSKSMAGGLRLGYAAAPGELLGRIAAAIRNTIWMAPPITAEIAARWIHDGTGERLAAMRREDARRRQALATRILAGHRVDSHPLSFHLWLHLPEPWRWSDFVAAAESRQVRVTPPDLFVIGRATAPHAVRLCLSAVESEERLEAGLRILAELLASPSEPRLSVI
jgi:DNA-binding transcriptional MocR family regulator